MSTFHESLAVSPPESHPHATRVSRSAVWTGAFLLGAIVFATSFNLSLSAAVKGQQFATSIDLLIRLAVCAACGLYGLLYLPSTESQLCRFPGAWAPLFALWCLFTIPFAESFSYVAAACASLWCVVLFAPAVLHCLGGRRVVLAILAGLMLYMLGSWVLYFALPEVGRYGSAAEDGAWMDRLGGDANMLGLQAAWAIAMLLTLAAARRSTWRTLLLPLAFAAITLFCTQSRTAMLAAAAIVVAFWWRYANHTAKTVAGCLGVALIAGWAAWVEFDLAAVAGGAARSGEAEEIYTLTGRTEIWQFAAARCGESPLLGHGHGCSRYALASFHNSGYDYNDLHHAHNQLLNVTLSTGLVGLAIVAAMFLAQIRRLLTRPDAFPDLVTVLVLVAGLAEVVLFGPMPRSSTAIWLIALFWRQMSASVEDRTTHVNPAEI